MRTGLLHNRWNAAGLAHINMWPAALVQHAGQLGGTHCPLPTTASVSQRLRFILDEDCRPMRTCVCWGRTNSGSGA